jgi:hypothetical protein
MVGDVSVVLAKDAIPVGSAAPTYTPCRRALGGGGGVVGGVVAGVVGGVVVVGVVVVGVVVVGVVVVGVVVGGVVMVAAADGDPKKVAEPSDPTRA